jgi:conjugative transfer signal peptidase TraF
MFDFAAAAACRSDRKPRIRTAIAVLTLAAGAVAIATSPGLAVSQRLVLFNPTPSEPIGLYVRAQGPVRTGRLVAFSAPPAAFPYADRQLSYLHHVPLLKAVAAGPGDRVCTSTGRLVINGRDRAPIAVVDGEGRALPHWRGCRALGPAEVFVFSARVPNSFDSRYFGPVPTASILGVYTPVFQPQETP